MANGLPNPAAVQKKGSCDSFDRSQTIGQREFQLAETCVLRDDRARYSFHIVHCEQVNSGAYSNCTRQHTTLFSNLLWQILAVGQICRPLILTRCRIRHTWGGGRAVLRGLSELNVPSTLTTTARPGDPRTPSPSTSSSRLGRGTCTTSSIFQGTRLTVTPLGSRAPNSSPNPSPNGLCPPSRSFSRCVEAWGGVGICGQDGRAALCFQTRRVRLGGFSPHVFVATRQPHGLLGGGVRGCDEHGGLGVCTSAFNQGQERP